jgi:Subtilase family
MAEAPQKKRHIFAKNTAFPERFTSPVVVVNSPSHKSQNRLQHGQELQKQLEDLENDIERIKIEPPPEGLEKESGTYIRFESEPGFDLKLESLPDQRAGIELVAVKKIINLSSTHTQEEEHAQSIIVATVFVPDGKLEHFQKKIRQYLEEDTKNGKPKNQALVESIARMGLAKLRDLWTDVDDLFPDETETIWWEAWLRVGQGQEQRQEIIEKFRGQAETANLELSSNELPFLENTVILIRGNPRQLSESLFLLDSLAEVRKAKETADFFVNLQPQEAAEWIQDAIQRIHPPSSQAPAVCLLDTGVNQAHPLISLALDEKDMHAYDPAWGTAANPSFGGSHGTEMAGLCLYGDITHLLDSNHSVALRNCIESVKILPPQGQNKPELYGSITKECIARAEISAPKRLRVICLAVTAKGDINGGRPSSWSSAIDQVSIGIEGERFVGCLILVSAGNANDNSVETYPDGNATDSVHDPAQAWNVITVGAYTDKIKINDQDYPGWIPLAKRGGLCPRSTTSLVWEQQWPIKPEIVLEGGNYGVDPSIQKPIDGPDSLRLLTTHSDFLTTPFTITGDTSAATALAARMAAIIFAEYPDFWPETVRALLVHSASWTSAMLNGQSLSQMNMKQKKELLRTYGYGVPSLDKALYSASNSLTLIAQDSIQPFIQDKGSAKAHHMNLHRMPWPTEVLQQLGEAQVEMRVTLSYFIEPNPGNRGYKNKFSYASHGLRFQVKNSLETEKQFRARINKAAREDNNQTSNESDSSNWDLGPKLQTNGCLHSDVWRGSAVALAQKDSLAVYPVAGWWKTRPQHQKCNSVARYALIVTIKTSSVMTDIYTPVENLIKVSIPS